MLERRTTKEDNIKILKVEYLSNHWSDLLQILNWSSEDQTKNQNTLNEEDLKLLKVEYLSNWLDLPQILNYSTYEFLVGN